MTVAAYELLIERFTTEFEKLGGEVLVSTDRASVIDHLESLCRRYSVTCVALSDNSILERFGIRDYLIGSGRTFIPPLGEWAKAKLNRGEPAGLDEFKHELLTADLGLCGVGYAIAATGTLVCVAEEEQNRMASLIPPVCVALVTPEQIVADPGEAVRRLSSSKISRAITFITGPSRTADIELTLTIGVHGPKHIHAIIVKSSI
jgi:L-lactate dehydrogenase complex protein LldG